MRFPYPRRWIRAGARRFAATALLAFAVGCASAPGRRDPEWQRRYGKQCEGFCRRIDACLGDRFDDALKDRLCELARCESGCRADAVAPAGYVGAFQFDRATWREVCGPIFARAGREACRGIEARRDACCAAICTATVIARDGAGRWPHCGR